MRTQAQRIRRVELFARCCAAIALLGCAPKEMPDDDMEPDGPQVLMHFDRAAGFYSAPFPSDDLRRQDGGIDLSGYPNSAQVSLIAQSLDLLQRDARGFGLASGIFFSLSADLDSAKLPTLGETMDEDASIFLFDVERRLRHPVRVAFMPDGGPFGAAHLLSILPVPGIPLRAAALYAAVIRRNKGKGTSRQHFGVSPEMAQLVDGRRPDSMPVGTYLIYQRALDALRQAGVDAQDMAGLTVFTTDDPTATLARFRDNLLAQPLPMPNAPFVRQEVFADYCVYKTTLAMLDYQQGTPPYEYTGGNWARDADGKPVAPHPVECNLVLTVPRSKMPDAGYPLAVFVRTGGGGDRPLVDRGQQLQNGGPPLVPGSGPALYFAKAGFAGVSIDGPLGGLRNPQHADEQFLIFNTNNAAALRDNVRESALELVHLPHILNMLSATTGIDTYDCAGAEPTTRFDMSKLALMGHSTGSAIAMLALAAEPLYRIAILSGAGGSWIQNVMYKRKPLEVRPLAEALLNYPALGRSLSENDPALSLVQWAAESADPQVYAEAVLRKPALNAAPRHVLMLQGIVDNYIRPPIALSASVPLGLDLGGAALDATTPELFAETHLLDVLPLVGRGMIALPAAANIRLGQNAVTGVVVQHPGDGIEDGHEVVFQTDPPKHQYRCFLSSYQKGVPKVPSAGAADAPCD